MGGGGAPGAKELRRQQNHPEELERRLSDGEGGGVHLEALLKLTC